VLLGTLVVVVVSAGVLGAVAVLMTRDPDSPLLGGTKPQPLAISMAIAPVKERKPAPCPGEQAALDVAQTTCYLLNDAVKVSSVQKIEVVSAEEGAYSVRIALPASSRDPVARLIDENLDSSEPIAFAALDGQTATVLAAPMVTQAMDGDSFSIAGFTKEQADALVGRLLGKAGTPQTQPSQAPTGVPGTGVPSTGTPGTGVPQQGTGASPPVGATPAAGPSARDKRYPTCQAAIDAGYGGPYHKGTHPEYEWYTDLDNDGIACDPQDLA
jgi:hypothetical protein